MVYTASVVDFTAVSPLERLLGSRLRARLLGWLFSHPDERFFVRQLAALLGEDSANLSRELARLSDLGIVSSSKEGQQKYYQADRSGPLYPELRGLVLKTAGLGDLLREGLGPLSSTAPSLPARRKRGAMSISWSSAMSASGSWSKPWDRSRAGWAGR